MKGLRSRLNKMHNIAILNCTVNSVSYYARFSELKMCDKNFIFYFCNNYSTSNRLYILNIPLEFKNCGKNCIEMILSGTILEKASFWMQNYVISL